MQPLRHAYTNDARSDGSVVRKRYRGPDADARQQREERALRRLAGLLPVPQVVDSSPGVLTLVHVDAPHGQDLIAAAHADDVLQALGRLLRRVQAVAPNLVFEDAVEGTFVHGDFGPNNTLFTADAAEAALLVDWEWCHVGEPVEDLAWCELIVRLHHRDAMDALAALFDGYGSRPPWALRQQAMVAGCRRQLEFARRWPDDRVDIWVDRITSVASWREFD